VFVAYLKVGREILLAAAKKKGRSGSRDSSGLSYDSKSEVLISLIGQGMCYTWNRRYIYTTHDFGWGNLKQRDRLENLVVNGRIILKWITLIKRYLCVKIV
jgi:hypothetical protein